MIAWKTWRDIRLLVLLYTTLLEIDLLISVLLWPWLRDQAPTLAKLVPADFFKRWVEGVTNPDHSVAYTAYMALQLFFKRSNIYGLAFAVLFGTLLVARERETHTLEFLLARPVSRSRILATKFAVMAVALVLPVLLTSWSAIPLSWTVDEDLPFGPLTLASAYGSLFCLATLTATAVLSARFRTQLHTAAVVGAVLVFQVCIYFIQRVRIVSLFRLSDYDVYAPILAGNVSWSALMWSKGIWVVAFAVVSYAAADRLLAKAEP